MPKRKRQKNKKKPIYEGEYKNDNMNGRGIYYYADGHREMDDFLNGKEIGKHLALHDDGKHSIHKF